MQNNYFGYQSFNQQNQGRNEDNVKKKNAYDKIAKLYDLVDKGALTPTEYIKLKNSLLEKE